MSTTTDQQLAGRPLVLASNRGPVSFEDVDGQLVARRAGGGMAATLANLTQSADVTWVAAAMSDADRRAVREGALPGSGGGGLDLRLLDLDPDRYRAFYDVVANGTLWFLHHGLGDSARRPRYDRRWREAWDHYVAVNDAFAGELASSAPDGAVVLVQDYHLALVGSALTEARPDLHVGHFSHTPHCGPTSFRSLPSDVAASFARGMAGFAACGFHCQRWADAFVASLREVGVAPPATYVAPLGPDPEDVRAVAAGDRCARALDELDELVGDRLVIARSDRIELSKNVLRGFHAFDELLATRPGWRERVVFVASAYPSREGLAEYLAYRSEIESLVAAINERWATHAWTPIVLDVGDDFPASVALLRRYDVLLVNPIRDGLNLVAREGPLVNERDGVLALSRETGVWPEMAGAALEVNPYDVSGTASVLDAALSMDAGERAAHAAEVRKRASARTPADWLADQIAAVGR